LENCKETKRFWRWVLKDRRDGDVWLSEAYYDDEGRDTDGNLVFGEFLSLKVDSEYIYTSINHLLDYFFCATSWS
jgi:hypothetical protein